MLSLERFSFGVGDRFAHQARAHLAAFQLLAKDGVEVAPVWNKSNREHTIIGFEPQSVFDAAQAGVKSPGWTKGRHVDADHIRLETVDRFMPCADFFTIDVADSIGKPAATADVLIMRPLLLRASSRSRSKRHRRVLRIEFAGFDLPAPLKWNNAA